MASATASAYSSARWQQLERAVAGGKRHGHGALVSAGGDRDEGEWSRAQAVGRRPSPRRRRAHEKQPPVKTVRILTSTGMTSNARVAPSG